MSITPKFISNLCTVALTALSIISCSKDDNSNQYSGKNQVYITAQGDKTLTIGESNQKIDAKVTLTSPVTQNTNLTLKALAASGNSEAQSILDSDGTSNPQHYVNNDKILTDEYEVGNWKASKGSINFQNKTMSFEFLVYHTYSNGYVQVKVEYTAQ